MPNPSHAHEGSTRPHGDLGLRVIRAGGHVEVPGYESPWPHRRLTLAEIDRHGFPHRSLDPEVNRWRRANRRHLGRGLPKLTLARALHVAGFESALFLSVLRQDGRVVDLGLAGVRVVTTAGVRFIADDFNAGTTEISNMKFHALGTGGAAEAVGNTALTTEITTQYVPDNTRPTGTQASATVSNDATYTTVGTITVDATVAATEHGVFNQAAAGGTLLDRTLFTVVNLANGDSLQATYVLTLVAGG